MKQAEKTNVMRILDQAKIPYQSYSIPATGENSASDLARMLGEDPARVFKTLVTVGKSGNHYVFMVPAEKELHLKKAAAAVGEKSIEMIKAKDLLPLTGYIHGGCSPIGMKKQFRTVVHETAENFDTIMFSAGKIGYQVELPVQALAKVVRIDLCDVVSDMQENEIKL